MKKSLATRVLLVIAILIVVLVIALIAFPSFFGFVFTSAGFQPSYL
jgi:hypothetical protein